MQYAIGGVIGFIYGLATAFWMAGRILNAALKQVTR